MRELGRVFQHVPENTMLSDGPVVIVGDMVSDTEGVATKGGSDEGVELTIQAVVEAEERKPLRRSRRRSRSSCTITRRRAADGTRLLFTGSDGFLDPETAQAYVGNFRFRCSPSPRARSRSSLRRRLRASAT
jgi:hypothetical protein